LKSAFMGSLVSILFAQEQVNVRCEIERDPRRQALEAAEPGHAGS